jgi:hypothetical protein
MTQAPEPDARPIHAFNDPDGDGHNCVDCSPDSMWKCDYGAHLNGGDATFIEGTSFSDPRELLSDKQQRELDEALERDARARRTWPQR